MAKPGRNDPCPCGSGKKYKKCCLTNDEAAENEQLVAEHAEREERAAAKLTAGIGSAWFTRRAARTSKPPNATAN